MSDRGGWDPWDFGDAEDEDWVDDLDDEELDRLDADDDWDEPAAWDRGDARAAAGGPPRGALLAALGVMLVLAVAIAALVLRADDDNDDDDRETASELETDDEPTSTSSSSTTSTTAAATAGSSPDVAPGSSTSTTRRGASTTRAPGAGVTTTTSDEDPLPACADGGGGPAQAPPDDWAQHWQTMPRPNDPATISICIDDVTPRVGQTVTVYLFAEDPDAVIVEDECGYLLTWEGDSGAGTCRDALVPHDGPRPTPPQEPGRVSRQFKHVYTTAGARTIFASVTSSRWEGYRSPYASYAEARLPVTVRG